jgi:xanthine dehydrogenase small subunit
VKTCLADVHTARDLSHAIALRQEFPGALLLAGGTDVFVQIEAGQIDPKVVINLWGCVGMRRISDGPDGGLTLGALCTWTDLLRDPRVPAVLQECARTVGAIQIQNRGTIGGNICNASPAGDSLPLWLVMDAVMVVAGPAGRRRIAANDFWLSYRKTALAPDEVLEGVELPTLRDSAGVEDRLYYRKVGTRRAQSISKVVMGARLRMAGPLVAEVRVAFGSVAPVPLRARGLEAALLGGVLDPNLAAAVVADVAPIDDVRSTAAYRGRVVQNVVSSWLQGERASLAAVGR